MGGNEAAVVEEVHQTTGISGGLSQGGDLCLGAGVEFEKFLKGVNGGLGGLDDGDEKKSQPVIEVVAGADAHEGVVVFAPMFFKVGGEIEAGVAEEVFIDQVEGDEETADAAIAIEEGVDRFEVVVADCDADELGNVNGLVVPEGF